MIGDEQAKAVQELAKTARDFRAELAADGKFVGGLIHRPADEGLGLVSDVLRYARLEIAIRFSQRVDRLMQERGLTNGPTAKILLPVLVPLLEAASLEEDEELADMWAEMLVNAADADSGVDVKRSLVPLLKAMSPLDVRILAMVVDTPDEFRRDGIVKTYDFPNSYTPWISNEGNIEPAPEEVQISLWNLVGHGCLAEPMAYGAANLNMVEVTALGRLLVNACRKPRSRN